MTLAGIDRLGESDHPAENRVIHHIRQGADFILGITVIRAYTHAAEFLEELGPACFHRMRIGRQQIRIAHGKSILAIFSESGQLARRGIPHPSGITQPEIMH